MKFCTKCGKQNVVNAKFCRYCGNRFAGETSEQPAQPTTSPIGSPSGQTLQPNAAPQPGPQPSPFTSQADPQFDPATVPNSQPTYTAYQQEHAQVPSTDTPSEPEEDPTLASTQLKHLWAKMRLFDHVCGMVPTFLKNNPAMGIITLIFIVFGACLFVAQYPQYATLFIIVGLLVTYIGTASTDGERMPIWDSAAESLNNAGSPTSGSPIPNNMTPADEVPGSVAQAAAAQKAGMNPAAMMDVPSSMPNQSGPTVIVNNNTQMKASNSAGTAGLVFALLSALFSWTLIVGIVLWLLGVLFSLIGLFKAPRGAAIAGFILSFLDVIIILAIAGGIASVGSSLGLF